MLQTTKDTEVATTTLYLAGRLLHLSTVCCWTQLRGAASAGSALLPCPLVDAPFCEASDICTAAASGASGLVLACASSRQPSRFAETG